MAELSPIPKLSANDVSEFVARESRRYEFHVSEFVAEQAERLHNHFPSARWSDGYLADLQKELAQMVGEFGEARTASAISEAVRNGTLRADGSRNLSFMPTIAELRSCVPAKKMTVHHPSPCPLCGDTGWQTVGEGAARRVIRCRSKRIAEA